MELGTIQSESAASQPQVPPPEDDIMQFARIGDVPAMEKLFESGDYDATYTDGEGITPLHVSAGNRAGNLLPIAANPFSSGQPLTTSTQCANSSLTTEPRSTGKEANQ